MNINFEKFNLSEKLKENLTGLGYTKLTTIQEKVIPVALEGSDLIGQSQTGTGKTAAFLIPIIEKIEKNGSTQALVLAPTRELALQIREEALKLAKNTNLSAVSVYGGESIENQIFQLKRKAEIVIGTPGRILDHLKRRTLKLDSLKFFVLDEVDEMLKRGFIDDIREIAEKAKSENLQTLFFSATISRETKNLANDFLRNPVFINNTQKDFAVKPLISQYYLPVREGKNKLDSLIDLIHFQDPELAIIFASTKKLVDVIYEEMVEDGFLVERIHSDLSQRQRTTVYNSFKNKRVRFLVATDIAARGIDVEGVTHVYNYDFPQDPEFYVHRIGRTGRAGSEGQSIIFLNMWEIRRQLPFLERLTGEKIQPIYHPSDEEIDNAVEKNVLEKVISKIKDSKNLKISENAKKILADNSADEILAGLISIFQIRRKKSRQNPEASKERTARSRWERSGQRNERSRTSGRSFSSERSSSFRGNRSSNRYNKY